MSIWAVLPLRDFGWMDQFVGAVRAEAVAVFDLPRALRTGGTEHIFAFRAEVETGAHCGRATRTSVGKGFPEQKIDDEARRQIGRQQNDHTTPVVRCGKLKKQQSGVVAGGVRH